MFSDVLSPSKARLVAVVEAWLQDTQPATSQNQHHQHSECGKSSPLCPSPARKPIALGDLVEKVMASRKRYPDDVFEAASTLECRQVPIDVGETPRARLGQSYPNALATKPNLNNPKRQSSHSSDALATSTTSTISRASNRIKGLEDLKLTNNPVVRSKQISELPPSELNLYRLLLKCEASQGILPVTLKDNITTTVSTNEHLSDYMFDPAFTTGLNLYKELAQVKGILRKATRCWELYDAKPGWNEQVNSRILMLALRDQAGVGFQNITTAKIHPPALNPININGKSLHCKTVDYAICLESDSSGPLYSRIRSTLQREPTNYQFINHTSFAPLKFRPIVASIVTKVTGNEAEAATQLSVWAVAHFKRLQRIIQCSGVSSDMPALPLIYVQGHDWFTMLAVQRDCETVLYGRVSIGTTTSIVGIYKILAALRILRDWADTVYRDWFYGILVSDET